MYRQVVWHRWLARACGGAAADARERRGLFSLQRQPRDVGRPSASFRRRISLLLPPVQGAWVDKREQDL